MLIMVTIDAAHPSAVAPLGLPGLDLNLLLAFDALMDTCNVTRAAERLGITQSAMSHKLRRLRDTFDDPLLVGGRQGMYPTPRAERLAEPVRRALRELRVALRAAEPFDAATARRTFVVASSDYAEFEILPRVLERLSADAPGVDVHMVVTWADLPARLESGAVDLSVGPELPPVAGLKCTTVGREDFVCLVRADHPGVGETLDLDTYLRLPHLLVSPGGEIGGVVDEALAAMGQQRRITMRTPHFLGGPFIAARSDLVMTAPAALARRAAELLPLRLFVPPLSLPTTRVVMTWHERFDNDSAHAFLRDLAAVATRAVVVDDGGASSGLQPGQPLPHRVEHR